MLVGMHDGHLPCIQAVSQSADANVRPRASRWGPTCTIRLLAAEQGLLPLSRVTSLYGLPMACGVESDGLDAGPIFNDEGVLMHGGATLVWEDGTFDVSFRRTLTQYMQVSHHSVECADPEGRT